MPSANITLRPQIMIRRRKPNTFTSPLPVAHSSKMKRKQDERERKSSSDSGGEQNLAGLRRKKKRIYHRHTQHQIQEMERLFEECPHPNEKMRLDLSRQLNLDPRQVKFWFQNKRTQLKSWVASTDCPRRHKSQAQQQRYSSCDLKTNNQKLKEENLVLREVVQAALCSNCGGQTHQTDFSGEELQQLRIENSKLKEEVKRISTLAAKHPELSRLSSFTTSTTTSSPELEVTAAANDIPAPSPSVSVIASRPLGLSLPEKRMIVELAVSAMEELAEVAQAGEPLWLPDLQTGIESLHSEEYMERFPRVIGPTPSGLNIEATRETDMVHMNAPSLIEMLMDHDRWTKMFPSIISKAQTVEVLSTASAGNLDGSMQLMYAELQLPTPLVPTREVYFLRYSKKVDHLWLVVDVSVDSLRGNPPPAMLRCRKRPSGCVIEETKNGYSKVTWVEHVEVDHKGVHPFYQMLVSSGMGFGARRWLSTLQRQCERIASLLTSYNISGRDGGISNPDGRRSLLKLSERMTNDFCHGVSASAAHNWITLSSGAGDDDSQVVIRKTANDPGRHPGILLSAATSLWLPVSPDRMFQFLRDERYRTEWDILSNMGSLETMVHVPKGQDAGNSVSLLRVNANQSNMMILQDYCSDEGCALVIYAPVDMAAMNNILHGGDSGNVFPLPSGFAILPDGPPSSFAQPPQFFHETFCNSTISSASSSCGSLLTIAFQILVDDLPSGHISMESVATINNLISSTVARIKGAIISVDNA